MSYRIWHTMFQGEFCALGPLEGVLADEEILRGMSRADGFPGDAFYEMRADYPKNIKIPDNLYTAIHHVVSARMRAALEPELNGSNVEFLPVRVKNHKGRFDPGEFFIVNALDVIDAIDVDASGGDLNPLAPTQLMSVDQVVMKPLPGQPALFRPANWTRLIFVRADIVEKLESAGLTGLSFWELDEFTG
jgi:hypothetical protein